MSYHINNIYLNQYSPEFDECDKDNVQRIFCIYSAKIIVSRKYVMFTKQSGKYWWRSTTINNSPEGWWCSMIVPPTNCRPNEHRKWWMLANVEDIGVIFNMSSHISVIHKSWTVFSIYVIQRMIYSHTEQRTQETSDYFSLLRFSRSLRNQLLCVTGPLMTL